MKEEEAIKRCNELIKVKNANWIGITNQKAIEKILDLLKENTAEIQQRSAEIIQIKEINAEHQKQIGELQVELSEKEKQIDLMAKEINNYDIDEGICKQAQIGECEEFNDNCIECIKQYFTNKVRENKDD